MRIVGQVPIGQPVRTASGLAAPNDISFRVEGDVLPARSLAGTSGVFDMASLQGLMALQEEIEPERSRRYKAARRGFTILDALGALKAGLLAGALDPVALQAIQSGLNEARQADQSPQLRSLLDAIDTRAAVELAKLGR